MLTKSSRRECRDHERKWRNFCVDKNLENEWLDRLNDLRAFNLIGICEGHFERRAGSPGRFPNMNLRLKEQLLPGIARNWDELRTAMLNEVNHLFQAGDTHFNLELKFKLRAGRGRLVYQEELNLRMRCFESRSSEEMGEKVRRWFEEAIGRIEVLDAIVVDWYSGDLGT